MEIVILYISVSLIYIFLVCLDGEDVKPKWKQWLADKLGIKPKIDVRFAKGKSKRYFRVGFGKWLTERVFVKKYFSEE